MLQKKFGPIRFIQGENSGFYPYCHSIYIEGDGILIDPGSNQQQLESLLKNEPVNAIWLSHYHDDHMRYMHLFEDLPFYISEVDAPPLSDIEVYLDWLGWNSETMHGVREQMRNHIIQELNYKSRVPSGFLAPGSRINLESVTVEIIATPGHTPGHLSFYFIEPEVLFMGDYHLTHNSPWYGDRVANIDQLINSTQYLRKIPAKTWIVSHGDGVFETEPGDLLDRFLGTIRNRDEKLLAFLSEPKTMQDIEAASFIVGGPRVDSQSVLIGERRIVLQHLQHLIDNSRVIKEEDRFIKIE